MREVFSRIGSRISCGANGLALSLICAALIGRRVFLCWALMVGAFALFTRLRSAPGIDETISDPPPRPPPEISPPRPKPQYGPPRGCAQPAPDLSPLLTAMHATIVGQREAVEQLVIALITGSHAVLEGPPGLAKTLACRTLAAACGLSFARIQCNADLSPAEIIGTEIFDSRDTAFRVRLGPIAANIVLADEINRAPARAQAAFFEAMEERQVTIGPETRALPQPFHVFATMNEAEPDGIFAMPRAQLDRFLLKIALDFPEPGDELALLDCPGIIRPIHPAVALPTIVQWQAALNALYCAPQLKERIVSIVRATRAATTEGALAFGAGPRASLALLRAARGCAALAGRSHVLPGDIARMAPAVLRHRVGFPREYLLANTERERQLRDILELPLSA